MPSTYYMDYVNGADASNGSSWATAKKTINGFTAAILVPGDVIRIAKSPDPTSLGQTATWTNLSKTVTLTSAVTANIETCDQGWTAGSGVTLTYDTSAKMASYSLKLVTDGTVTTARKLAYKTLTSTDFSGYKQISFWFNNAATLADGTLQIKLCSDTTGDTAVDTLNIPAVATTTSHWMPVTIDKGSALGAAIQSVAIYCTATYASKTNYFDCIIACKDSTAADSLSLTSLISKNNGNTSEGWYPIQSINGTTIILDGYTADSPSSTRGYYGDTENVTTYKRETIKTIILDGDSAAARFTVQDAGTLANPIQWQGGYNTSTSIQDGETFFDGSACSCIGITSTQNYNSFNYISTVRYYYGMNPGSCTGDTISNCNTPGCIGGIYLYFNTTATLSGYLNCNNCYFGVLSDSGNHTISGVLNVNNATMSTAYGAGFRCYSNITTVTFTNTLHANNCALSGVETYNSSVTFATVNANYNGTYGIFLDGSRSAGSSSFIFNGDLTCNGNTYGLYVYNAHNITFNGKIISTSLTYSIYFTNATTYQINFNDDVTVSGGTVGIFADQPLQNIKFNKTTTISSTSYAGVQLLDSQNRDIFFKNLVLTNTGSYGVYNPRCNSFIINSGSCTGYTVAAFYTPYDKIYASNFELTGATYATGMTRYMDAGLYLSNCGVVPYVNKIYVYGGLIQSDMGTRHTASGISWRLSPTSTDRNANYPLRLSLAKIAVNANALVTVTAWFRRDNASITGTLFCEGYQVAGITDAVYDSMTGDINTWEQLSISFLPTSQGVVEICALAYGGSSYNVWVDDMGVSQ